MYSLRTFSNYILKWYSGIMKVITFRKICCYMFATLRNHTFPAFTFFRMAEVQCARRPEARRHPWPPSALRELTLRLAAQDMLSGRPRGRSMVQNHKKAYPYKHFLGSEKCWTQQGAVWKKRDPYKHYSSDVGPEWVLGSTSREMEISETDPYKHLFRGPTRTNISKILKKRHPYKHFKGWARIWSVFFHRWKKNHSGPEAN